MKILAHEIDGNNLNNSNYLYRWDRKFKNRRGKINNNTCINCTTKLMHGDVVYYVACYNGCIKTWHKQCVKKT